MGLVMGLIGGGGSIITVPLLVYFYKIEPTKATLASLLVVGSTAIIGIFSAARQGNLRLRESLIFAIPSLFGVVVSRVLLVPKMPDVIFHWEYLTLTKNVFLMAAFAGLMILAATKMIRSGSAKQGPINPPEELRHKKKESKTPSSIWVRFRIPSQGLLVGLVTGFLGAGGGFLMIPALVFLIGLPMKQAVGTSLLIIAINSLFGFFSDLIARLLIGGPESIQSLPWTLLLTITVFAIGGLLIGSRIQHLLSDNLRKKIFGWIVLTLGSGILLEQMTHILN
jgi:uncharacterized membrane protein YfcA